MPPPSKSWWIKNKKQTKPNLQGSNGRALESQVRLEILCNLPDQTLERKLPDEQLGGLLVPTDLTQGNSARPGKRRENEF